ncbi:3413_t:CDS:2 [Acaulospora morrowiae]|uniref:3413_t:CDS:1 n=1 Tax=Acaulospora morrowiae TaxID=94023 RepID=A0A9N8YY18_9GLOM|nr:3413_t:CDS:2 [Acaulospora morrowiae]
MPRPERKLYTKNKSKYDEEDIEEISRIQKFINDNVENRKKNAEDPMMVDSGPSNTSPKNVAYIYPYEFWSLDPISQSNVKLFNKDYNNLKVIQYRVDDGSATIQCTAFFEKLNDRDEWIKKMSIVHGTLVKIIGKIDDPNMELLRWTEIIKLKEEYYSKPFVIPEDMLVGKTIRGHQTNENAVDSSNVKSSSSRLSFSRSHSNKVTYLSTTSQHDISLNESFAPLRSPSSLQKDQLSDSEEKSAESDFVVTDNAVQSDEDALFSTSMHEDLSRPLTPVNGFSVLEDFLFLPNIFKRLTDNETIDFSKLNLSQITEDVFINIIVRYIYEKQLLDFEFSLIRQASVLIEYATLVLRNQHDCNEPTPEQLTDLFTQSLLTLVNEEFLLYTDEKRITYKIRDEFIY